MDADVDEETNVTPTHPDEMSRLGTDEVANAEAKAMCLLDYEIENVLETTAP
jgi:hypothetical protein